MSLKCAQPKTAFMKIKEAETEQLNQLCLSTWRSSFQGKPNGVPEFCFNKEIRIVTEHGSSEPLEKQKSSMMSPSMHVLQTELLCFHLVYILAF